jgi:hypothetical protein
VRKGGAKSGTIARKSGDAKKKVAPSRKVGSKGKK